MFSSTIPAIVLIFSCSYCMVDMSSYMLLCVVVRKMRRGGRRKGKEGEGRRRKEKERRRKEKEKEKEKEGEEWESNGEQTVSNTIVILLFLFWYKRNNNNNNNNNNNANIKKIKRRTVTFFIGTIGSCFVTRTSRTA